MKVKYVPQSIINAKRYFQETVLSGKNILSNNKFVYKPEDVEWMGKLWVKVYDKIKENPENYYMVLTLLNRNTKSGKFALIYNDLIFNTVEKRKDKEFMKLLINPEFPELFDNKLLSMEEKSQLQSTFKTEMMTINLLIKIQENSHKLEMIPSNLYNECFMQVSALLNQDLDLDLLKHASFESSSFITIPEYNENTDTYHMYSFDVLDLIHLIVFKENNVYTGKPFSEQNIENITMKHSIEMKMIKRSYGK
jgi:hypothetical protein